MRVDFSGKLMRGESWEGFNLCGADAVALNAEHTTFRHCCWDDVNAKGFRGSYAKFITSYLSKIDFSYSTQYKAVYDKTALRSVTFDWVDLSDTEFRDIAVFDDISMINTTLPDGIPYVDDIYSKLYAATVKKNKVLFFDSHVVRLAGSEGRSLAGRVGIPVAAAFILKVSDSGLERTPSWTAHRNELINFLKRKLG